MATIFNKTNYQTPAQQLPSFSRNVVKALSDAVDRVIEVVGKYIKCLSELYALVFGSSAEKQSASLPNQVVLVEDGEELPGIELF